MTLLRWFYVGLLVTASLPLSAQDYGVPRKSEDELASHLMVYVAPTYPPDAIAAHLEGDVVAMVEVGPDGLVRSAKVIRGPAKLRSATVEAVKHWRYVPFQSGNGSTAVSGNVLVHYTLEGKPEVHTPHESTATGSYSTVITLAPPDNSGQPDEEIADRYEKQWNLCSRGVIAHENNAETANACKNAAAIADEFAADSRYIERRQAYVYAAIAFANVHDLATALSYADKAVSVVKLGHDGNSGSEAAYSTRGKLRAFSGDLAGGDADITVAEQFGRKTDRTSVLKEDLQFHAELLRRMNRANDAQVKLDEAGKLSSEN